MLLDSTRLEAFCDALEQVVEPHDVVLELGAGTGFFSCYAAKLGAKKVHAVEFNPLVHFAEKAAAENGLRNLQVHHRYSYDVNLEERASVLIHDMKSQMPFAPGTRSAIGDALERLLTPDAKLVPRRERVFAALVHDQRYFEATLAPWAEGLKGLTFDCILPYCSTQESYERLEGSCRGPAVELLQLDYRNLTSQSCSGSAKFRVTDERTWHGIVFWFESELCEGVTLTTDPWASQPATAYANGFTRFKSELSVFPEQDYQLELTLKDSGAIEVSLSRDLGWTRERLHHFMGGFGADAGVSLSARVKPEKAAVTLSLNQSLAQERSLAQTLAETQRDFPGMSPTDLGRTLYAQAHLLKAGKPSFVTVALECFGWPVLLRADSPELLELCRCQLLPSWQESEQTPEAELDVLAVLSEVGEQHYQLRSGSYRRNFSTEADLLEALESSTFEALRLSLAETHLFLNGSLIREGGAIQAWLGAEPAARLAAIGSAGECLSAPAVVIAPSGDALPFQVRGRELGGKVGPLQEIRFLERVPPGPGASLLALSSLCYRKGAPPLARLAELLESCELGVWAPRLKGIDAGE